MTAHARTYDPDGDSDFDTLFRTFIIEGADGIDAWSTSTLDECRSCADAKMSCAAYADDHRLRTFRAALDDAIATRYADGRFFA